MLFASAWVSTCILPVAVRQGSVAEEGLQDPRNCAYKFEIYCEKKKMTHQLPKGKDAQSKVGLGQGVQRCQMGDSTVLPL